MKTGCVWLIGWTRRTILWMVAGLQSAVAENVLIGNRCFGLLGLTRQKENQSMTVEEIEGMTDAEWDALSDQDQAAAAKVLLDTLVSDGLAYLGPDGRYRIREDVTVLDRGGFVQATRGKLN